MSLTLQDSFDSKYPFIPSIANAAKLPNVSIHVPDLTSVTAQSSAYLAANGVTLASTGALYDGLAALSAVERVNIAMGFPVLTDRQHIYVKGEGSIRRYWNATAGNAWSAVVSPSVVVSLGSDTASITEGSGVPTGGAANDHKVDFAANVIYKNTAGTWAVLRSATAQQIILVPLTGATTLYADLHGTSAGFQITYSGANANLTLATDAQATAAGRTPWFPGNAADVLTLDGSAGVPTLVAPDGKTETGSPTKEIGGACKAANSWTLGTTDPAAAAAPAVFGASGTNHAAGLVPDPGATAGTTKFLREDGTFAVPAGGGASSLGSVSGVTYDTLGRVTAYSTAGIAHTVAYTNSTTITDTSSAGTVTYGLDGSGRFISKTASSSTGSVTGITYNTLGRVTAYSVGGVSHTVSYPNTTTITDTSSDGTITYGLDGSGRFINRMVN